MPDHVFDTLDRDEFETLLRDPQRPSRGRRRRGPRRRRGEHPHGVPVRRRVQLVGADRGPRVGRRGDVGDELRPAGTPGRGRPVDRVEADEHPTARARAGRRSRVQHRRARWPRRGRPCTLPTSDDEVERPDPGRVEPRRARASSARGHVEVGVGRRRLGDQGWSGSTADDVGGPRACQRGGDPAHARSPRRGSGRRGRPARRPAGPRRRRPRPSATSRANVRRRSRRLRRSRPAAHRVGRRASVGRGRRPARRAPCGGGGSTPGRTGRARSRPGTSTATTCGRRPRGAVERQQGRGSRAATARCRPRRCGRRRRRGAPRRRRCRCGCRSRAASAGRRAVPRRPR